jgi:serine/threonine protein phosphatase PrpC
MVVGHANYSPRTVLSTRLLEEQICDWLLREPGGDRAESFPQEQVCLVTSQGQAHGTNQDRVAFLEVGQQVNGRSPIAVLVVADGISGMSEGGRAASLAIAALAASLTFDEGAVGLKHLLLGAVRHANERVFSEFRGRGGTTISAIIYGNQGAVGANVGDSRIYSFDGSALRRLTIDDTLGEHLRAHRKGSPAAPPVDPRLVQFVGIGNDLEPHVIQLEPFSSAVETTYLLSSDGGHFLGDSNLEAILKSGASTRSLASRVIDTARALGSTDDATAASLPKHLPLTLVTTSPSVRIRTPGRELFAFAEALAPQRAILTGTARESQSDLFAAASGAKDDRKDRQRKKRPDPATSEKGKKLPKRGTTKGKRGKRSAPILQLLEGDVGRGNDEER